MFALQRAREGEFVSDLWAVGIELANDLADRTYNGLSPSARRQTSREDLRSAGYVGVGQCVERFREGSGASFRTYAWRRVSGAILGELERSGRISSSWAARLRRYAVWRDEVQKREGRSVTAEELAVKFRLPVEEVLADLRMTAPVVTLSGDEIARESDSGDALAEEDFRALVLDLVGPVLVGDLDMLCDQFVRDLSVREIGAKVGLSHARVVQRTGALKRRIRASLAEASVETILEVA